MTGPKRNRENRGLPRRDSMPSAVRIIRIIVFGAVLLVLGAVAYLTLRSHWIGPPLAHAGALGLILILGAVVALIARWKGYAYGKALSYGISLPILIGMVAVVFFYLRQGIFYCGGSVVLGISVLLIIIASMLPRKATTRT